MTISDLDRAIRLLERAAMEPTTVGDTPVVIVDVNGDCVREALATLRSMRERAVEGWVDEVAEHARDCACNAARTWMVSADCGHIPDTRRPALLIPEERNEKE